MKELSWFAYVVPVVTLALGVAIGNFIGKRNDSEFVEQGRLQRRCERSYNRLRDRQRNIGRRIYNALLRNVATRFGTNTKKFAVHRIEYTSDGLYRILISCVGPEHLSFTFDGRSYSGHRLFQIEVDTVGSDPIEVSYFPDLISGESGWN